jgi:hypothetical protein
LYIIAAPLLVLAMMIAILASKTTHRIFGHDPVALLVKRHHREWTILAFTGRCTLGLMFVGLLLLWAF